MYGKKTKETIEALAWQIRYVREELDHMAETLIALEKELWNANDGATTDTDSTVDESGRSAEENS